MNAYSPPDDNDRKWNRYIRNKSIAKAVRAGVELRAAIVAMDATGYLQDSLHPNLTVDEAVTDFRAWVQEQALQAATDVEDARRDAAEVAELRSLISR